MANPFGTLSRQQVSTATLDQRTKIKAIGAFTNMYLINRESKIVDEELAYLEAVESGDLRRVEEMLTKYKTNDDDDDSMKSISLIENGIKTEDETGVEPGPCETSFSATHSNAASPKKTPEKETKICVEMVSVGEEAKPEPAVRKRRVTNKRSSIVAGHMWQKAAANVTSPLPVTFARKTSFTYHNKNTLEVETDSLGSKRKVKFNKNCKDQWGRSALFIAMIHQNLDMLELLLNYKVKSEECLYHAIDFGYYDIVEVFMHHDKNTSQMIKRKDSFYPPGLTPFQLAAHKNDYVMLKILHSHGYDITNESKKRAFSNKNRHFQAPSETSSVLDRAWDSSNHQLLYYRAISSPAYLVMTFMESSEGNWDFLETIFDLYAKLKKKISNEPSIRSLYQPLADQVEDFACDLLSEVRSSSDLASLLRFDPPGQTHSVTSTRNHLIPVQRAIEVRMKRFVAHENTQLAISTMRMGTLFENEHGWRTITTRALLALIFPILCLGFSVFPESKFGMLLRNPMVNMSCHITSEILFLILMLVRLLLLTMVYKCDCLGTSLYSIDYIILLWVLARLVNQAKKFRVIRFLEVIKNVWMLNDLATSSLFVVVISLKIYDMAVYSPLHHPDVCPATVANATVFAGHHNIALQDFEERCTRSMWTDKQSWPITISEASMAFIYLLIHIRAMELLYTDRTFGPLQLSLDKMLLDTIRFLFIFFVTFLAFAFAMTQIYWAWGRPRSFQIYDDNSLKLCQQDTSYENATCYPVYSYIRESLLEQYWTLYGYGWGEEPPSATKIPPAENSNTGFMGFTEIAGQFISMIFHAWSIVVMLNMLVAMMSHSFDRVRDNAELEWKFHRSVMWMKFIRKGIYPRPPPMNLIPSTRDLKSFWNFVLTKTKICCDHSFRLNHPAYQETTQKKNKDYREAVQHITNRYMSRYLLPDFRHDEIDQPVNRGGVVRRGSSIADPDNAKPSFTRSSEA